MIVIKRWHWIVNTTIPTNFKKKHENQLKSKGNCELFRI